MRIQATYDGTSFQPDQPPELAPNTRVTLEVVPECETKTVEKKSCSSKKPSFFEVAMSLKLDLPADASERFEEYLYGNLGEEDE